jgi:hypothetical protein
MDDGGYDDVFVALWYCGLMNCPLVRATGAAATDLYAIERRTDPHVKKGQ